MIKHKCTACGFCMNKKVYICSVCGWDNENDIDTRMSHWESRQN